LKAQADKKGGKGPIENYGPAGDRGEGVTRGKQNTVIDRASIKVDKSLPWGNGTLVQHTSPRRGR